MVLMIDYDNLGRLKRRSLSQIIQILTEKIPESNVTSLKNGMKCRLYGGWLYRGNQRTRMARDLLRQIHGEFPLRIRVHDHQGLMKKPELATSLICDPMSDFPDTFRIRSQPPRLNVRRFPLQGCRRPISCPISAVNSFWYHKTCVHENCRVSPDDAFIRPEQKLVDSMIVVDLIHSSTHQKEHVVLVSGDDDMWPGIRYALLNGACITHLVPRSPRRKEYLHDHLLTNRYTFVEL